MPEAQYLLRFDDICPTMDWDVWEVIERALVLHDIRPILAVIPDNKDPKLLAAPAAQDFWDRVRRWQAMGYTIGLHGHQHVYVNSLPGLMKLTPHSEFAGLSFDEQNTKIRQGLAIFAEQGVRAELFVAPSHSFDRTTLEVLQSNGLTVISDGPWAWPHLDREKLFWVPQQLWRLSPRPAGVWTVCLHHSIWSEKYLANFVKQLARFAGQFTDLPAVTRTYASRQLTVQDRLGALARFAWRHRVIPFLKRWLDRLGLQGIYAR